MTLDLILKDIKDPYVRENFVRILEYLSLQVLTDFKFFEVNLKTGTKIAVAHGLKYIPRDVILTSILGDQNVFFNYMDFDAKNIYITSDGPCTVRFFLGSYDSKDYNAKKIDSTFVAPNLAVVPVIDGGSADAN